MEVVRERSSLGYFYLFSVVLSARSFRFKTLSTSFSMGKLIGICK